MANAYRVIAGPWLLWAACWMASARSTKPSVQSEAAASRLIHLALLAVASALLVVPGFGIGLLGWRSLPDRLIVFVIGAILEALGLGWAVWARVHLGQYWSRPFWERRWQKTRSADGSPWRWSSWRLSARSGSRKSGSSAIWARNRARINAR